MDALECCKQHDGPVTAKDIEKLKAFTESEIIAETVFFWKRQLHLTSETQSWMKVCQIYFKVPLPLLIMYLE